MAEWGNQQGPQRLPNFRLRVPDKLCPWIYIWFLCAFQFSNGFYFTTMAQVAGERGMTMNDTHMFGQTVLIGLTFFFPLAFRLKFHFTNRTSLTIAATALAVINLLFPMVHSYPLMLVLCYLGGFFRLYGTFECFSNLLPRVTPTYNYAVFLTFVFFVVIGCVNVVDWLAMHIIYYYSWEHIHLAAVGLCLSVIAGAQTLMRPFRPMPKMHLKGLDPLGLVVWSIFILSAIYVAQYGEQYDWTADHRIRAAAGISLLALAAALARMWFIRHPFIDAQVFHQPRIWHILFLFLCLDILLGTQHVLQNTLTGGMLHYEWITSAQLKLPEFLGAILAAVFFLVCRVRLGWHLKTMTFCSMAAVVAYQLLMIPLISPNLNIEQLWLPLVVLGFGHVGVFIALTVYAQANSNFTYYFQVLCVLGFIRTGIGDVIGVELWNHALKNRVQDHLGDLALSLQELYGWAFLFGLCVLMLIMASRFDRLRNPLPKLWQAYTIISRKVNKQDKEENE